MISNTNSGSIPLKIYTATYGLFSLVDDAYIQHRTFRNFGRTSFVISHVKADILNKI